MAKKKAAKAGGKRKVNGVIKRALAARVRHLSKSLSGKRGASLPQGEYDKLLNELRKRERELSAVGR